MYFLYLLVGLAFFFGNAATIFAEDTEPYTHEMPAGGIKPDSKKWSEVVGKKVVIEGVAWGSLEQGFGEYVLLDGPRVYVENAGFLDKKAYGGLVRVMGKLTLEVIPAAKPLSQGPTNEVQIYKLREVTWEKIDRVDWPWMKQIVVK